MSLSPNGCFLLPSLSLLPFFLLESTCYFEDGIELVRVGIDPDRQLKVLQVIVKVFSQVDLDECLIDTVDLIYHIHELCYFSLRYRVGHA